MYIIVEFTEESTVGIVAKNWTYQENGQQYSYWPPSNQTKRAKKEEIPDEEHWISRKIRIFANTDNFDKALKWCKAAELHSAVETEIEDDTNTKRPKKRPFRYDDSSDDETPLRCHPLKKKNQDGPFPRKKATIVEKRPDKAPEAKLPIPPQHKPSNVKDSSQNPTCDHSDPTPSHDLSKDVDESPICHSVSVEEHITDEERQTSARASWNDPMKSELKETLEVLLRKVDSLASTQREILLLLRKRQGHQREEDILELKIAQTKEELEVLDHRLKDSDFRKRVIHHLSLIGGANPGDCVRRVMRAVATNIVWSHFSLKGKREKLPLIDTTVCKVIKHAVMKCKSDLGEKDVECYISETLKHVPAQLKKYVQDRLPVELE
ncbi:uncharacterized protein LOC125244242 [Megalobrama amblycephala]|uniref:uncharacterized protein LOC125244242 n=1 Tax=Megalobrama amblycephala TaxID=75352 RepID=UPI0020142155|nr:uncharacterized protein LOC125244242 [Megalobrama amblycephala]XP_048010287.1 uncharacterized protein LOC125244242 [Megalobrama amblycephala]